MKNSRRALYRHADLVRTLSPRSVAVIGASARPGSFGNKTIGNLEGFRGTVYLVNERYEEIGGRRCYPSIDALPEVPDCAIVAVPSDGVEGVLDACAARGVGGAIVFASGFAESGVPERIAAQDRLGDLARRTGLRVVGPNCVGILNHAASLRMSFAAGLSASYAGSPGIGIASQSGGMGNAVAQMSHYGVAVSHMLAAGNSCDVDVADYVAYLAEEDSCAVIVCLLEGLADPRRLIEAGEIARERNKPLIICKIGTSAAGAEAAKSHTGVLAGSNAAWQAAFRNINAVVVDNLESLARTASFFLKVRKPSRGRVMVMASSGGFCTIAADKAELFDVELAQPSDALRRKMETLIPTFGKVGNPTDMTAQWTPESLGICYGAAFEGDEYDTVVSPVTLASGHAASRVSALNAAAKAAGKVGCLVWTPAWINGPGFQEAMTSENLAVFLSMEDCFRTLGAWQAYERRAAEHRELPPSSRVEIAAERRAEAERLLRTSGAARAMSERESKALLRRYGLPVIEERLVASADEAVSAAHALGFPVVMKLEVDGLAHKTEAGGVALDIRSEADVRRVYEKMRGAGIAEGLRDGFRGILVQRMAAKGLEIIAGGRFDPQFGPMVMVGFGGILVEILQDTTMDFAPLTPLRAEAMLRRLRGYRLLTGVRGSAPVDIKKLAEILCRLSEFMVDHADQVEEVDINPLICSGEGIVAVDALVVRRTPPDAP